MSATLASDDRGSRRSASALTPLCDSARNVCCAEAGAESSMCAVGCSARAADSCERAERQRGAPFPDRSSRVRRAGVGSGAGPGRWDRSLRRVGRGAWPGGELGGERAAPRAGAGTAQPASLGQPAGRRWAVPARCVLASR